MSIPGSVRQHLLSTLLRLGFIFTNLSLSPLLAHVTVLPHSLVLTVQSALAYNSGFPDPGSSFSPSFLSSFSFFYPCPHAQFTQTHTLHPWSISLVPHLTCLFPSPIISCFLLFSSGQPRCDLSISTGLFSPLTENGIWDSCPIKQLYKLHLLQHCLGSGPAVVQVLEPCSCLSTFLPLSLEIMCLSTRCSFTFS